MKKSFVCMSCIVFVLSSGSILAECPSLDLTGDCFVDLEDFAVLAGQWQTGYDITDLITMADQWNSTDLDLPDDLVYIPDHQFEMGGHFGDEFWENLHWVFVDAFFINRYEITNLQYCDFLNSVYDANDIKVVADATHWDVFAASDITESYPYYSTYETTIDFDDISETFSVQTKGSPPRDVSNDPVTRVSWYGAAAYCNWLSIQTGKTSCYNLSTWECNLSAHGYRLPTEAEWEYAARGSQYNPYYRFPWGNTISHTYANYKATPSISYDVNPVLGYHPDWEDGEQPYTSPVGSFLPNGFGLYEICGNVNEWCNDWGDYYYYSVSPYDNPTGPDSGTQRIYRGGSWETGTPGLRVADRYFEEPQKQYPHLGFRVVLNLD